MKIEYLESEGFFTSIGFFKIWNYSSGKNFPIFGQYFVSTLCYIIYVGMGFVMSSDVLQLMQILNFNRLIQEIL